MRVVMTIKAQRNKTAVDLNFLSPLLHVLHNADFAGSLSLCRSAPGCSISVKNRLRRQVEMEFVEQMPDGREGQGRENW
jgi:hypothetical protein